MNLDINGYLLSPEFLGQVAAFVATLLNLIFQSLFGGILGLS